MNAVYRMDKNTTAHDIPEFLQHEVIHRLAHQLFSSMIANAVVSNVNTANRESVLNELLQTFFIKFPDGKLLSEISIRVEIGGNVFPPIDTGDAPVLNTRTPATKVVAVASDSNYGVMYTVVLEDGHAVSCSCKGFEHRNSCKHLARAERLHR